MRGLKALTLAILAAILTLVLPSCTTSRIKSENEIVLTFPTFPDPIDADGKAIPALIKFDKTGGQYYCLVLYNEKGEVLNVKRYYDDYIELPMWYWQKIINYVIYVDEAEEVYKSYKNYDPG